MRHHGRSAALLPVIALLGAALLTGCSSDPGQTPGDSDTAEAAPAVSVLTTHGLDGSDTRALIEELDTTPVGERSTDFMAQVRPDQLVISDATGAEASLSLPTEEFYVSIAPFIDQTHECFFHSLTTCQGELAHEPVDVTVVDDSGTVLVDETMTTFDNGFLGLWLPRDITATITLAADGRTVTDSIATGADDPTCVTTLQLS